LEIAAASVPSASGCARRGKLEAMGGDARATTRDEMKALVSRQYETR